MKIGKPVPQESVARDSSLWVGVVEALNTLKEGMALPVEMETTEKCRKLQTYIYAVVNHRLGAERKYCCVRRKNIIYIQIAPPRPVVKP